MCFKNLPIEFDSAGKARLLEGSGDPFAVTNSPIKQYVRPESSENGGASPSSAPPRLREWSIDPVTRVARRAGGAHDARPRESQGGRRLLDGDAVPRATRSSCRAATHEMRSTSARGRVVSAVACTRPCRRWRSSRRSASHRRRWASSSATSGEVAEMVLRPSDPPRVARRARLFDRARVDDQS